MAASVFVQDAVTSVCICIIVLLSNDSCCDSYLHSIATSHCTLYFFAPITRPLIKTGELLSNTVCLHCFDTQLDIIDSRLLIINLLLRSNTTSIFTWSTTIIAHCFTSSVSWWGTIISNGSFCCGSSVGGVVGGGGIRGSIIKAATINFR